MNDELEQIIAALELAEKTILQAQAELAERDDRIEALTARDWRTLADTQRLIWRDDVEGICPSPDVCFEYVSRARCGPCAIKQSLAHGVEPDMSLPNLPEVSRLRREIEALTAQLATARESERAAIRSRDAVAYSETLHLADKLTWRGEPA